MPMKGKSKILIAMAFTALMTIGATAQPTDFNRVDDSGTNVDNTTITHVPENSGSLYLPENDSTGTIKVKVNPDDSHEFNKDTEVNVTATLYDDSGTTYSLGEKTVTPATETGQTGLQTFTVEYEVTRDTLNASLDIDNDIGFESTTTYVDEATGNTVTVNEETWFTVTQDSIAYSVDIILSLVPIFIIILVIREFKSKK